MGIISFYPSYIILKCIYIRNFLSLNFSLKNRLINGNLIFATLIPLTLSLSNQLLSVNVFHG